ncbi:hypothetical protein J2Z44_000732 [Clostridium punense]|uniref:Uncharacterized protein n=1 Tax=Clostridium punense TaxID=1054297 RepID=A0ABS4JZJ7_9CLOT|nr:hypothetical protein [Clostridium punense]
MKMKKQSIIVIDIITEDIIDECLADAIEK